MILTLIRWLQLEEDKRQRFSIIHMLSLSLNLNATYDHANYRKIRFHSLNYFIIPPKSLNFNSTKKISPRRVPLIIPKLFFVKAVKSEGFG